MKKAIFLTGATGFIGTNIIAKLNKKYDFIAIVRENSNTAQIEKQCEIYRYKNIDDFIAFCKGAKSRICGVLHLATLYVKSHNSSEIKSIIDANVTFGAEIIEGLARVDFGGFFVSVGTFWQFYKNYPNNPLNLYAASKSAFERIVDFYANTTEMTFTSLFLNDTYGPNDTRQKIFNLWINAGDEVLEMSGGAQEIDLIFIDDVINAFEIIINLATSKNHTLLKNKKFTLHCKERKTLRELSEIFQKVSGKTLKIAWGAKEYMKRENFIPFEFGDELPSWEEKTTFEMGIKKLLDSAKKDEK
ncbi:NAD-dependent epimerase/dehydratase family protein [Helicobacter sp. 23-1044]